MPLFSAVEAFKVTLWLLSLFFLKLALLSFLERATGPFAWFLLRVFKAPEAVIEADCQVDHFVETFRVGDHCHCALNPRFQAVKESRHPGPVIPGNPGAVLVEFGQVL
jgi:hypothetical protein